MKNESDLEKKYNGYRLGMIDIWISKAASSINGTVIVISFLIYVFLSSFKIQYHGAEIIVRTDVFNTVFMAFYGLVMTYAGYLWGASKPQTDTIKGMQSGKTDPLVIPQPPQPELLDTPTNITDEIKPEESTTIPTSN